MSKFMLTIYKPWIENVDGFLNNTMQNPKDSCSSHLCGYMSDEEFSKTIMMNILRAKIALDFRRTVETNVGLDSEYSLTLNRENEDMAGDEKINC